jgi:hypothetical protein
MNGVEASLRSEGHDEIAIPFLDAPLLPPTPLARSRDDLLSRTSARLALDAFLFTNPASN